MDPSEESRGYSWDHVAFGLGVAALLVSFAVGLMHARERGIPRWSLDVLDEVRVLESRGEWKQAMRRYEALARLTPTDPQMWRKVAEMAARADDRDAESRARGEIARLEGRR